LFVILVVSMLLMSALAPAALAEPKPADEYIPFEVDLDPGFAFEDWWIELNPDEGGTGIELPQADDEVFGDPDPEADPTSGLEIFRGLDMGFNFKYFEGPSRGIPTYDTSVDPPVAVRWSQELTNEGYDKIWVGTNGYLVFGYHCDLTPPYRNECRDWFTHDEIGGMVMYPVDFTWYRAVPSPARPNNLLNVFMTDLIFGDNTFVEVDSVAFRCLEFPPKNAARSSLVPRPSSATVLRRISCPGLAAASPPRTHAGSTTVRRTARVSKIRS
jgi:hypothetical protein